MILLKDGTLNLEVKMKKIAVFCASRMPKEDIYKKEAINLGNYLVDNNIAMVYGGAKIGIMGLIADTMLNKNGTVIGVMPTVLSDKEILHPNLTESYPVDSMHERKAKMMDLADAFIAFPGGCGTMEEIFEVITWNQIGLHSKSYGFINVDGIFDGLKQYFNDASEKGFIDPLMRERIIIEDSVDAFFKKMKI